MRLGIGRELRGAHLGDNNGLHTWTGDSDKIPGLLLGIHNYKKSHGAASYLYLRVLLVVMVSGLSRSAVFHVKKI